MQMQFKISFQKYFLKVGTSESVSFAILHSLEFTLLTAKWHEIRNRRKFFESYAKRKGFDPLNPENWYSFAKKKLLAHKV
jgi:hypothetical protein